jgi:hypothetical protein
MVITSAYNIGCGTIYEMTSSTFIFSAEAKVADPKLPLTNLFSHHRRETIRTQKSLQAARDNLFRRAGRHRGYLRNLS